MIPFHVRALKLLLNDLQSSGHEALALAQGESQVRKDRAKEVDVDVDLDKDDDAEVGDCIVFGQFFYAHVDCLKGRRLG